MSCSVNTPKFQSSNEKAAKQKNQTPFNVPPVPQRAPGHSGCPSETSIEVPERLRTSLQPDPPRQTAAARPSLSCSSSFPLKTGSSAHQKHLKEKAR